MDNLVHIKLEMGPNLEQDLGFPQTLGMFVLKTKLCGLGLYLHKKSDA